MTTIQSLFVSVYASRQSSRMALISTPRHSALFLLSSTIHPCHCIALRRVRSGVDILPQRKDYYRSIKGVFREKAETMSKFVILASKFLIFQLFSTHSIFPHEYALLRMRECSAMAGAYRPVTSEIPNKVDMLSSYMTMVPRWLRVSDPEFFVASWLTRL